MSSSRMPPRRLVLSCGALTATFAAGYGVMFTVLDDFRDDYGISAGALGAVVEEVSVPLWTDAWPIEGSVLNVGLIVGKSKPIDAFWKRSSASASAFRPS